MTRHIHNPLTFAWSFLTMVTLVSWWVGHNYSIDYRQDTAVTFCVLSIASIKTLLVMYHFMEVRFAPLWLKACTYGLVGVIYSLLFACYALRPPMS